MEKTQVIEFLRNFNMTDKIINEFLENKKIITKNNNVYLSEKEFDNNQIMGGEILFVNLTKQLPSKFLLKFIKEKTKALNIKNSKRASDFTYGESVKQESFSNANNLKQDVFYIIEHKGEILGYANFFNKQLHNIMNIGEYLQEKKEASNKRINF